jgi:hypothetical protein
MYCPYSCEDDLKARIEKEIENICTDFVLLLKEKLAQLNKRIVINTYNAMEMESERLTNEKRLAQDNEYTIQVSKRREIVVGSNIVSLNESDSMLRSKLFGFSDFLEKEKSAKQQEQIQQDDSRILFEATPRSFYS